MTVERNGDLAVTETIAVQAEGNDIRRGILRDFPTTLSRRRDGSQVEVGFRGAVGHPQRQPGRLCASRT